MATDTDFNLRDRLKVLRVTQVGFAALLEVNGTTVRNWVRLGTPGQAQRMVEILEYQAGISPAMPEWLVPILAGQSDKRRKAA